jgi:MFS family permease
MGIIGALAPLGGVAGPGIGGLLLASFGWSAVFFVNVPVCLLAALLGIFSLRGVRLGDRRSASAYRHMLGLLRRPQFLWGLLAFFCSVTVAGALYYLLPFDISNVQHIAPSLAGVILLCVPLGMGVMGLLGSLPDRNFVLGGKESEETEELAERGLSCLNLITLCKNVAWHSVFRLNQEEWFGRKVRHWYPDWHQGKSCVKKEGDQWSGRLVLWKDHAFEIWLSACWEPG